MARLAPEDQQLLRLRYHRGQSVQAISRTLRTDPRRLYRRFERVRRSMRRSLQEAAARCAHGAR
jgi:DNA-directed RNA polymerase specialized sigma24 family protein